jgi:choline dehydrogenase-like flavoprotein
MCDMGEAERACADERLCVHYVQNVHILGGGATCTSSCRVERK